MYIHYLSRCITKRGKETSQILMFTKTAERITEQLKEANAITTEQYKICKFGVQQGLTILLNLITVIILASIMGEFWQIIFFMIVFIPLRVYAGGFHAKTPLRCYAYSIFFMIIILVAMKYSWIINKFTCIVIISVSSIIIGVLAPVETENKPLEEIERKVYRKKMMQIIIGEDIIWLVTYLLQLEKLVNCLCWSFIVVVVGVCIGKLENKVH